MAREAYSNDDLTIGQPSVKRPDSIKIGALLARLSLA